jgi:hypothetical protein
MVERPFPLTPALSLGELGERENRSPLWNEAVVVSEAGRTPAPKNAGGFSLSLRELRERVRVRGKEAREYSDVPNFLVALRAAHSHLGSSR